MITIVSIVLTGGEANMAALWVAVSGGRREGEREYWLMLICFASMLWCVSIGSRGPGINAAVLGLPLRSNWTFILPLLTWYYWPPLTPDPLSSPPTLSGLIICQLLTLTRLGINQRWQTTVTTKPREVTAVNAVPGGGEDDSHLCHVYGAQAHQCGTMIEL